MTETDGRKLRGNRTRASVLDAVVSLASVEGLDGLSLSQLAARLDVTKSALFTHWRGKEELQLAALEHASTQWVTEIIAPALEQPTPLQRLWALHERRLDFYAREMLPGRCFFSIVYREFDDRPGVIHDRLIEQSAQWHAFLTATIDEAIEAGQLCEHTDSDQLAYEIDSLGEGVVSRVRMLDPQFALAAARAAVLQRLRAASVDPDTLPES
ncbi:TetR/AcrR family transcriptional regulator [Nocardia terpenica]|uniref:TetR family transcriptional regulator n=1 Tax=Nocardia terpenica TaxID=455432 RepID=A0A164H4L5_9NOCA|nr:helix-turn-helix domain-containing protein [Nocardia terpenica]KZM68195.1 TetR family transcriptional regulator [Nocardia terpenica]NQE88932.1 TetR/AcrR family transcriptional regulator [Nocardia terpenica]